MQRTRMVYVLPLLLALALIACVDTSHPDALAVTGGELSTGAFTVDHGELWLNASMEAKLTRTDRAHTWTFALPARARLDLRVYAGAQGPDIDAVAHVYQSTPSGWSHIARTRPCDGGGCSTLSRALGRGRYRVLVQGRTRAVRGPFSLSSSCTGPGCPVPAQPQACVLGNRLHDVTRLISVSTVQTARTASALPDALAAEQLVLSAADGPECESETPDELFERVDEGLVHWLRMWDLEAGREFRAYEYRIAGKSYGGVFMAGTTERVARVDAGRLLDCAVPVRHCTLGRSYHELRESPEFTTLSSVKLDAATGLALPPVQQTQLLRAVQVAYEDATDVEQAFESVDQGEVNQISMRHDATGRLITVYEYGAGDNSYGGMFAADGTELVARIHDGDLYGCTMLE